MPAAGPAGESAYGRDYRVGGALKRVVDDHPGASLVALHHDRKAASEDFVDSVSGTHGLAGAADTVILLSRHVSPTRRPARNRPRRSRGRVRRHLARGVWSLAGVESGGRGRPGRNREGGRPR